VNLAACGTPARPSREQGFHCGYDTDGHERKGGSGRNNPPRCGPSVAQVSESESSDASRRESPENNAEAPKGNVTHDDTLLPCSRETGGAALAASRIRRWRLPQVTIVGEVERAVSMAFGLCSIRAGSVRS